MGWHRCERFVSRQLPCPFQPRHEESGKEEEDRGRDPEVVKEKVELIENPPTPGQSAPVEIVVPAPLELVIAAPLAVGAFAGARKAVTFQEEAFFDEGRLPVFTPASPILPTIPQPPPVQPSPPSQPVSPIRMVNAPVPARNVVEQMMAVVEEDLASKMEIVAHVNAPATASLSQFQEEAFPNVGALSLQQSIESAMAAAMPQVMSFANFLFRTAPPNSVAQPIQGSPGAIRVIAPPNSVRVIKTMVTSGALYTNRGGGGGGLVFQAPTYRPTSIPIGGYRLSDDFSHLEVFQEEAFGP